MYLKKAYYLHRYYVNRPKITDPIGIKYRTNDIYTSEMSKFVTTLKNLPIRFGLEGLPDSYTAGFSVWQLSQTYGPFLSTPRSHSFPKYMQEELNPPTEFNFIRTVQI